MNPTGTRSGTQGDSRRHNPAGNRWRILVLYTAFAAIATLANIVTQDIVIRLRTDTVGLVASVLAGTAVGLVTKYLLDKTYIFGFRPRSRAHDGATFLLYTGTGVVTTLIFWGTEAAFHMLWDGDKTMRYLGAAVGLAIGYAIKYRLDRRFVFRAPEGG
ncbi:GtrA family protein [Futiania mangrovi]|uniref:GtrA family protein n=1 Tax=Futiania mangrovi TaxID=2959716 RepID=A0A9J6PF15_9PROT|nr:GtrA family protein [Futiania mangrovii]MCP1336379.1 GtrA family protein [Futiania mangrovii]